MSALSADRLPALKVAISASISLMFMVMDFVWLIRDEVKYVWPNIRYSWYARFYVLSRYTGLASQIFNIYFTVRMYCGIRTSPAGCMLWFAYQAVVVQFLLVFVEGLLMHRVYALFLRSRVILLILIMFAVGQVASMVVSAHFTLPNVGHTETCIIVRSGPGNAYFGATTMTTNIIVFFMTFWRYLHLPARWTQRNLARVMIRDSAIFILALSIVMLFLTLSALQIIRSSVGGNITYPWLVCILWVSIGRIIMNHEKLHHEDRGPGEGTWKSTVQLTTQIELGEISQWSTVLEGNDVHSLSDAPTSNRIVYRESPPGLSVRTSDMVQPEKYHQQGLSNEPCSAGPGLEPPSVAVTMY